MTLKRASLLAVGATAVLALAAIGWLGPSPAGSAATAHNPLHVNCPPGSHGQPRTTGVGQSLDKARQGARAARSLESRALTAQ